MIRRIDDLLKRKAAAPEPNDFTRRQLEEQRERWVNDLEILLVDFNSQIKIQVPPLPQAA